MAVRVAINGFGRIGPAWYAPNGRTWRDSLTENICKADPIAWMNLPAPYQPKGE